MNHCLHQNVVILIIVSYEEVVKKESHDIVKICILKGIICDKLYTYRGWPMRLDLSLKL